jgi:tetratricopeptide (TPR) repeat protein
MTTWDPRANELFLKALEMRTAGERQEFLDGACAGDAALRAEVESLLEASVRAGSFLEPPAAPPGATVDAPGVSERPDTVIGPYKLVQMLGEGGMGAVFMAQQTEPIKRLVALKLIKPGMDTRQVIARFEAERQALALMEHPNIAKVFDAGTTELGRPYFVMELVKGVPITRYCDQHRLTPRQRLELFIPVCQAVQHAHQKGIIHRDLKPSNVLVASFDDKPVPKVIDFGIAKAAGQSLTEKTLITGFGVVVGTLEYMSPEQAELNQLDIDTRSDIYSLGVLLYELLTGSTPLEKSRLKAAAMLEVLRLIREEEPPKPSARLSTTDEMPSVAANRGLEPKKLSGVVRGELDWMVMKCLEKDRNRRYETANGLAMDVQRYLADEPVQACPPSATYRLRKFARRNKVGLAIAGMILFFLVLLAGGIGWVARDQAARLVATEQLVGETLYQATELLKQGKLPEAHAAVRKAEGLLAGSGGSEALRQRVRELQADVAMVAKLEEIRIRQTQVKDNHFDNLSADSAYAQAFRDYGIDVEKLELAEAAERLRARPITVELAAGLDEWASVRRGKGEEDKRSREHLIAVAQAVDPDEWRNRVRAALKERNPKGLVDLAASSDISAQAPSTLVLLADALAANRSPDKAVALLEKAWLRHPGDFWINHALARNLGELRPPRWQEALRYFTAEVSIRPQSPGAHYNLGFILRILRQLDAAIAALQEAIRLKPDYAAAHSVLGMALADNGQLPEAITAYNEAIRLRPDSDFVHYNRGCALNDTGDHDAAIAAYSRAIELNRNDAKYWINRGSAYHGLQQWEQAITDYSKGIQLDPKYKNAWTNRAKVYLILKQYDKAVADYSGALQWYPQDALLWNARGLALVNLGQAGKAIDDFSRAIALSKPEDVSPLMNRARAYRASKQYDKEIVDLSKVIALFPKHLPAHIERAEAYGFLNQYDKAVADYSTVLVSNPKNAAALGHRGVVFSYLGQMDKAVADCTRAIELSPENAWVWGWRGRVYHQSRQWEKAAADFSKSIDLDADRAANWHFRAEAYSQLGQWDKAVADYSKAIELDPKDTLTDNNTLAWLLATCPEPKFRDPKRAVELAKKAIALAPKEGSYWNTLGVAHYRTEDWQPATTALLKSMELRQGGDSNDWFFLATAQWRLDRKKEAG